MKKAVIVMRRYLIAYALFAIAFLCIGFWDLYIGYNSLAIANFVFFIIECIIIYWCYKDNHGGGFRIG